MSAGQMPTITEAQVAVLIERLDNVISQQTEMKGMLQAQAFQLGAIPVMQAQLLEFGDKFNRAFTSIRDARTIADEAKRKADFHGAVLKGAWTVLIVCLGLIGWGWKEGKSLYEVDRAADRRLILIEYKLGITPAEGAKE